MLFAVTPSASKITLNSRMSPIFLYLAFRSRIQYFTVWSGDMGDTFRARSATERRTDQCPLDQHRGAERIFDESFVYDSAHCDAGVEVSIDVELTSLQEQCQVFSIQVIHDERWKFKPTVNGRIGRAGDALL